MTLPTGGTLATLTGAETLTDKTLTSPIINTSPTAAGATWTDLGSVTTVDINSGTIDGASIGGAAAAPGTFTNLTATQGITVSSVTTFTATGTAAATDFLILVDASTASFTLNLATAVGITGKIYVIKKIVEGVNTVTVDAAGTETIDGATTQALVADDSFITVISDGDEWHIISQ